MPNYRNGAAASVGDQVVLVGAVDAILGNDELVVDMGPRSVRVAAAETLPISEVGSGGGGVGDGVDWQVDDTFDYVEGGRWNLQKLGGGNSFLMAPGGNLTWLADDPGMGFLRLTPGTGTGATDWGRLVVDNRDDWPNVAGTPTRVYRWRAAISHSTNIRASLGLAADIPAGTLPSPSVAFVFDSAEGFRLQHDNGAATTSDAPAGALGDLVETFAELELRCSSAGIDAYVNDTLEASIAAVDLPTGADRFLAPFAWCEGNGSVWRSLVVDRFRYGRAVA